MKFLSFSLAILVALLLSANQPTKSISINQEYNTPFTVDSLLSMERKYNTRRLLIIEKSIKTIDNEYSEKDF